MTGGPLDFASVPREIFASRGLVPSWGFTPWIRYNFGTFEERELR
jgi:hypothetical protein